MDELVLVLVRHAKSSWKLPLPDRERPLNGRGRRDAPFMAARFRDWLTAGGREEVTLVVSPARRAQETADAFELAQPPGRCHRRTEPALYGCSAARIIGLVSGQPSRCRTLVLFGHNPEFTEAINDLSGAKLENLPTCGVACLRPRVSRWSELRPRCCDLLELDYPKLHAVPEHKG